MYAVKAVHAASGKQHQDALQTLKDEIAAEKAAHALCEETIKKLKADVENQKTLVSDSEQRIAKLNSDLADALQRLAAVEGEHLSLTIRKADEAEAIEITDGTLDLADAGEYVLIITRLNANDEVIDTIEITLYVAAVDTPAA